MLNNEQQIIDTISIIIGKPNVLGRWDFVVNDGSSLTGHGSLAITSGLLLLTNVDNDINCVDPEGWGDDEFEQFITHTFDGMKSVELV